MAWLRLGIGGPYHNSPPYPPPAAHSYIAKARYYIAPVLGESALIGLGQGQHSLKALYQKLIPEGMFPHSHHVVAVLAQSAGSPKIQHLLRRPVGRPPNKPIIWYDEFQYQAGGWDRPRRVVAKVEWHQGKLFPRVGFIVTTMTASPEGVVHFYK